MKIHCRYDRLVNIHELRAFPKNRNIHTPEQIERLAKLLRHHGVRAPIIVAKDPFNCIAKGHGTIDAMKLNGWTEAPIVEQEFENEDQLYSFVQSDNAIAAWSELDLSMINLDLSSLGPFDLDLLGIENFKIDPSEIGPIQNEKEKCPTCGKVMKKD